LLVASVLEERVERSEGTASIRATAQNTNATAAASQTAAFFLPLGAGGAVPRRLTPMRRVRRSTSSPFGRATTLVGTSSAASIRTTTTVVLS
jgi:hypothetical protein